MNFERFKKWFRKREKKPPRWVDYAVLGIVAFDALFLIVWFAIQVL